MNGLVRSSSLRTSLSFLLKMCMNKLHLLGYRKGRLFFAISWQIACDLNHIQIQWLFNSKNCFLSPVSLWEDCLSWEKIFFPPWSLFFVLVFFHIKREELPEMFIFLYLNVDYLKASKVAWKILMQSICSFYLKFTSYKG